MFFYCWLDARKSIWPVKFERYVAGMVIHLEWNTNDLHGSADAPYFHPIFFSIILIQNGLPFRTVSLCFSYLHHLMTVQSFPYSTSSLVARIVCLPHPDYGWFVPVLSMCLSFSLEPVSYFSPSTSFNLSSSDCPFSTSITLFTLLMHNSLTSDWKPICSTVFAMLDAAMVGHVRSCKADVCDALSIQQHAVREQLLRVLWTDSVTDCDKCRVGVCYCSRTTTVYSC